MLIARKGSVFAAGRLKCLHLKGINAFCANRPSISHSNLSNSEKTAASTSSAVDRSDKPNNTQLTHVVIRLSQSVPQFFHGPHSNDYTIYNQNNFVFENRIWNSRKETLLQYRTYLGTVKIISSLCFLYSKMETLNIVPLLEDGTVRVRWRVRYFSIHRIFNFLFYLPTKANIMEKSQLFDAYSIFYVGRDGLVFKHVVDRVIPDDDVQGLEAKKSPQHKLAEKLGVLPKTETNSASAISK